MTDCRLCIAPGAKPEALWNQPILESPNFRLISTLGCMVEGWVLVVPRQHVLSLAALDPRTDQELEAFVSRSWNLVEEAFGPACAFEHGPAQPCLKTGCGVDHAHLHILPSVTNLVAGVDRELRPQAWLELLRLPDLRSTVPAGNSYILVAQPRNRLQCVVAADFPSQLLRRVVASGIGRSDAWNWREHAHLVNASKTYTTLRGIPRSMTAAPQP